VGGDENSAKDVGKAIAGADRLRQEFGCAVLLVHHTGKNGDQERGSSALRAAADAMLKLTADDGALTLSCEKMKDAAPFETEYLRLQATEDGETCIVKPSSGSPVVAGQLTKNHRLVLEALHDLPDGEASWSRIQKTSAVAEGSLARILSGLVKRGFIEKEKRHYALTERGRTHVS
jgi:predicted transcriptional regulator